MENSDILQEFMERIIDGIKADAEDKGQKIPTSFRVEASNYRVSLYGPDYFKYLVSGRGPGKQPPPDRMLAWVEGNPETSAWTDQEKKSLAYQIGRKIAREGTDIWSGKRQGVDLPGVLEKAFPDLMKAIAKNTVINIETALRAAIK